MTFPKLIFVTGKGGAGKSFVCFELAKSLLEKGLKVAIIESSLVASQSRNLELPFEPHVWKKSRNGIYHLNVDVRRNFSDFIDDQLGKNRILKTMLNSAIVRSFLEVIPGLADLLLLGRICHEALENPEKFDHVIFDGAASGHFFQLMATPAEILRAEVVGPLFNKTKRLLELLKDPKFCEVIVVALAKDLVIQETREFTQKYKDLGYPLLAKVFLNRMTGLSKNDLDQIQPRLQSQEKLKTFLVHTEGTESTALKALNELENLTIVPVYEAVDAGERTVLA